MKRQQVAVKVVWAMSAVMIIAGALVGFVLPVSVVAAGFSSARSCGAPWNTKIPVSFGDYTAACQNALAVPTTAAFVLVGLGSTIFVFMILAWASITPVVVPPVVE